MPQNDRRRVSIYVPTRQHGLICGEFLELVRIVDFVKFTAIALAAITNPREEVAASRPRFKR